MLVFWQVLCIGAGKYSSEYLVQFTPCQGLRPWLFSLALQIYSNDLGTRLCFRPQAFYNWLKILSYVSLGNEERLPLQAT